MTPEELSDLFSRFEDRSEESEGISFLELTSLLSSLQHTGAIELAAPGYQAMALALISDNIMDETGTLTFSDSELPDLLFDPAFHGLTAGPNF